MVLMVFFLYTGTVLLELFPWGCFRTRWDYGFADNQKRALAFYDVFNYVMIIVYLHCLHTMTLKTKQDNVKETKKEIKM